MKAVEKGGNIKVHNSKAFNKIEDDQSKRERGESQFAADFEALTFFSRRVSAVGR